MTDDTRGLIQDLTRRQLEHHHAVYEEVSAIRVSVARIEERLESQMRDDIGRDERWSKLAATVLVLEGAEARREERARIAKRAAQVFSALVGLALTVLGIATAIAQWGK